MTEQDRRARENLLRLHAARPDSALADFAKDVLSGRRELRDLAHDSAVADEVLRDAAPSIDAWRDASDAEREQAIATAPDAVARLNATLAGLAPETLTPQRETAATVDEEDDWSEWTLHDHSR
jgi:hypothetical protein